jgi:xylulokinase
MQMVADVLQVPLQRLTGHPGSCLGVAWTAAMAVGLSEDWSGVSQFVGLGEVVKQNPDNAAVHAAGYATYRELYRRMYS